MNRRPASTLRPLSTRPRKSDCSPWSAASVFARNDRRSLRNSHRPPTKPATSQPQTGMPVQRATRAVTYRSMRGNVSTIASRTKRMDGSLADAAIVVLTNLPDRATAGKLARALVEGRLAACVNVGAAVESIYHWRGQIETASEVPLAVKTRAVLFSQVEAEIRRFHPYELPEI